MEGKFNINSCPGWEYQEFLEEILHILASGENRGVQNCYDFLDFLNTLHYCDYHIDSDCIKSLECYVSDFLDGEYNN